MKKYILLPLAALVMLAGCTTKEQDQEIRAFWMKQYMNVMVKLMSKKLDNLPQAARQKLAAQQVRTGGQNVPQQRTQPAPQPQIMEVTLDTDALPGRAPHADRVRMKRALEAVQISNQNTLTDIAVTFGNNVKTQALVLTAGTERQLKQAAANSANFAAYFAAQQQLLAQQEQKLNQLMKQNAGSIKKIRK